MYRYGTIEYFDTTFLSFFTTFSRPKLQTGNAASDSSCSGHLLQSNMSHGRVSWNCKVSAESCIGLFHWLSFAFWSAKISVTDCLCKGVKFSSFDHPQLDMQSSQDGVNKETCHMGCGIACSGKNLPTLRRNCCFHLQRRWTYTTFLKMKKIGFLKIL